MSAIENLTFLTIALRKLEAEYVAMLELLNGFEDVAKEQRGIVFEIDAARCRGERFGAADSAARDIALAKARAAEEGAAMATAQSNELGMRLDRLIAQCQRAQAPAALELEWKNKATEERIRTYYGESSKKSKRGLFSFLRPQRVEIF
jgi:hypothetical protein